MRADGIIVNYYVSEVTLVPRVGNLISKKLIRVSFLPWRDNEADVLSVSPWTEQIEGSWVVQLCLHSRWRSHAIAWKVVIWTYQLIDDWVGATSSGKEELNQFFNSVLLPSPKTWGISKNSCFSRHQTLDQQQRSIQPAAYLTLLPSKRPKKISPILSISRTQTPLKWQLRFLRKSQGNLPVFFFLTVASPTLVSKKKTPRSRDQSRNRTTHITEKGEQPTTESNSFAFFYSPDATGYNSSKTDWKTRKLLILCRYLPP